MVKVGSAIEEMFPQNGAGIDSELQAKVIRTMYERNTAIPFYAGEEGQNLTDA